MPNRRTLLASAALGPLLASSFGAGRHAAAQEATPGMAPGAIEQEIGVVYGEADGQELLLDVARPPARTELRPAVVL